MNNLISVAGQIIFDYWYVIVPVHLFIGYFVGRLSIRVWKKPSGLLLCILLFPATSWFAYDKSSRRLSVGALMNAESYLPTCPYWKIHRLLGFGMRDLILTGFDESTCSAYIAINSLVWPARLSFNIFSALMSSIDRLRMFLDR